MEIFTPKEMTAPLAVADALPLIALGACIVFLRLNGIEPKIDGPEWDELTLTVAASAVDRDKATKRLRKLLPKHA